MLILRVLIKLWQLNSSLCDKFNRKINAKCQTTPKQQAKCRYRRIRKMTAISHAQPYFADS